MTNKITVPKGFRDDFNFYCAKAGLHDNEIETMRNQVREDFNTWGKWVTEGAICYRLIDSEWGGVKPSAEQCKAFLVAHGIHIKDETLFGRLGIMLQVKMCAKAAGLIRY